MEYANERGKICLFTEQNMNILILNIDDHMSDVKSKSEYILQLFNPSDATIKAVFEKMLMLINSPKEGNCESGALLAKLVSNWGKQRTQPENFPVDLQNFTDYLLSLYKSTLVKCRENFLQCARSSPLYGIITSLRKCLLDENSLEKNSFTQEKLREVIELTEETVDFMLSILSGNMSNSESANPDFQEMAVAIDKIIAETNDINEESDETVEIPEDHQLILSAAWHSLKECAL